MNQSRRHGRPAHGTGTGLCVRSRARARVCEREGLSEGGRETHREGYLLVLSEVGHGEGGQQAPVGGDGTPLGNSPGRRGRALDDNKPAPGLHRGVECGVGRGMSRGRV